MVVYWSSFHFVNFYLVNFSPGELNLFKCRIMLRNICAQTFRSGGEFFHRFHDVCSCRSVTVFVDITITKTNNNKFVTFLVSDHTRLFTRPAFIRLHRTKSFHASLYFIHLRHRSTRDSQQLFPFINSILESTPDIHQFQTSYQLLTCINS
jgi:hypothetical protein